MKVFSWGNSSSVIGLQGPTQTVSRFPHYPMLVPLTPSSAVLKFVHKTQSKSLDCVPCCLLTHCLISFLYVDIFWESVFSPYRQVASVALDSFLRHLTSCSTCFPCWTQGTIYSGTKGMAHTASASFNSVSPNETFNFSLQWTGEKHSVANRPAKSPFVYAGNVYDNIIHPLNMYLLSLPCGRPCPNHRKDSSQLDKYSLISRILPYDVREPREESHC